MIIEPALPTEVDALAVLVNSAYRGHGARRGWTHEAALLAGQRTDPAMLRDMLDQGTTILVARHPDGAAAGCVAVGPMAGAEAAIGMLTVAPDQQGRRVGGALLAAAEGWIGRHGGTRATITVIEARGELIAWYERRGYLHTGATQPFPYGDARFGLPLRDDLRFIAMNKPVALEPNRKVTSTQR